MNARRELTVAVLAAAAAGGLGLLAGGRPWLDLTVTRDSPLPPSTGQAFGSDVAALVPGLAIVVLAGAAGLLATRRWGRTTVGVLVLACGVGMLAATAPWLAMVSSSRAAAVALDLGLPAGSTLGSGTASPWIAVLAAALAILAGGGTVLRSWHWPAMGARYDAPAAAGSDAPAAARYDAPAAPRHHANGARRPDPAASRPETLPRNDRDMWDALDRGEDPTRPGR